MSSSTRSPGAESVRRRIAGRILMPYSYARLPDIVSYEKWLRKTSSRLQVRSGALKRLDEQILHYGRNRTTYRFHELVNAFENWKASVGPGDAWKQSSRNDSEYFTLLDRQLRGEGDTDAAAGAMDFMTPALI